MERRRTGARLYEVRHDPRQGWSAGFGSRVLGTTEGALGFPNVRPSPVGRPVETYDAQVNPSARFERRKPGEWSGTAHRTAKRPVRACLRVTTRSVRGRLWSGEGSARIEKVREGSASSVLKRHR